ncbi:MAG: hypothetical protein CMN36_00725 [SAR116 cluster bacterium]|nr:hypothetical protein [SAR116 cluster bacterium]HCI19269.1 hypothetical protein [Alphaproteobacteria bacterium]
MFRYMPSCKYIAYGATANRRATLRCCTTRSERRMDGRRSNLIRFACRVLARQIFIATPASAH